MYHVETGCTDDSLTTTLLALTILTSDGIQSEIVTSLNNPQMNTKKKQYTTKFLDLTLEF